jgi:UPF0271 protein
VRLASSHDVAIGAHPSYPDRERFGRVTMSVAPTVLSLSIAAQIESLVRVAAAEGARVTHVKPHGALYNMAARDRALADAIVRGVRAVDADLVMFGLSGSALVASALAAGMHTASEAFSDRGYLANGSLAPRNTAGAVVFEADLVARRAIAMVLEQQVIAVDGAAVALTVDTLCVHSDTPEAGRLASGLRRALEAAGISVVAVTPGARA